MAATEGWEIATYTSERALDARAGSESSPRWFALPSTVDPTTERVVKFFAPPSVDAALGAALVGAQGIVFFTCRLCAVVRRCPLAQYVETRGRDPLQVWLFVGHACQAHPDGVPHYFLRFGKWRGIEIRSVELSYLQWVADKAAVEPHTWDRTQHGLVAAVTAEIARRCGATAPFAVPSAASYGRRQIVLDDDGDLEGS